MYPSDFSLNSSEELTVRPDNGTSVYNLFLAFGLGHQTLGLVEQTNAFFEAIFSRKMLSFSHAKRAQELHELNPHRVMAVASHPRFQHRA